MSRVWTPSAALDSQPETRLRPYSGGKMVLRAEDLAFFKARYEIPSYMAFPNIGRSTDGRYLLPIFDPKGGKRGVVARIPWDHAPLWATTPIGGPKADTFRSAWGPVQSHYSGDMEKPLVLVEDQLSAIKLAAHGYGSVALLGTPADVVGTYGGTDRVAEIATRSRSYDEVIVALDADATDAAFKFVRKWGSAFRRIRVAILSNDIKDTRASELAEVLGV